MHECFPKHLSMGTARLKQDNETEEENKNRKMTAERKEIMLSSHVRLWEYVDNKYSTSAGVGIIISLAFYT